MFQYLVLLKDLRCRKWVNQYQPTEKFRNKFHVLRLARWFTNFILHNLQCLNKTVTFKDDQNHRDGTDTAIISNTGNFNNTKPKQLSVKISQNFGLFFSGLRVGHRVKSAQTPRSSMIFLPGRANKMVVFL